MERKLVDSSAGFAREFSEILPALARNSELREAMCLLIAQQPMPGKVTEGGNRLGKLRLILEELARGRLGFYEAFSRVELEISRHSSAYGRSNLVFSDGWAERLVRTQFSRFYNQAVMEHLLAIGHTECFVPHSFAENSGTPCSQKLAGRKHNLKSLYQLLINSYAHGQWRRATPTVPDHPHCTHVVVPNG